MRYVHKRHEVDAVQWRGDNRAEVEEFLTRIGAKNVVFGADGSSPEVLHLTEIEFEADTQDSDDDHWCDRGDWITKWAEGGRVVVMPDQHFRFVFEAA